MPENKDNVFRKINRINENDRLEALKKECEMAKAEAEKAEKHREEYEKELYNEKVELIKKKNQIDGEEENNSFDDEEYDNRLSFGAAVGNFFYHNKWWIGIVVVFLCIGGYLIYDLASKVTPDITVMYIAKDDSFKEYTDKLAEYLETKTDDFNGDGRVEVDVIYMPMDDTSDIYYANQSNLYAQLKNGTALLVISNEYSDKYLDPDNVLVNLEEMYPDNSNVSGRKYYLKDSALCSLIGCDNNNIKEDLYLGIRQVVPDESYTKKMQKYYDFTLPVLESIINEDN